MRILKSPPLFTVFTPTFNRAATLPIVHASLCAQTFSDFEWLIVDDGSTDTTAALVKRWIADGGLELRYLRQPNAGKHVAFNHGVREARGELFLPLDSDDVCLPDALATLATHWRSIPESVRDSYSGITGLCLDESGAIVGGRLPAPTVDGRFFEVVHRLRRRGEMWGFHRTEVLRRHPFPQLDGERFVPEALLWNRIARTYCMRFIDEPIRLYRDSSDGLTAANVRLRHGSPESTLTYYLEAFELPLGAAHRARMAVSAVRFAAASPARLRRCLAQLGAWALPALPVGMALAWRDAAGGHRPGPRR